MPALLNEPLPLNFSLFNPDDCPIPSASFPDAIAFALEHCPNFKFLPSNYDSLLHAASPATAHFACDEFRMYEFKVRRCMKGRSHDWTECPFAHPGEKARRRDPRRIHYSGAPCPDFRKGSCRRGDACEFAHGVFECWLHPARYRTQACKDGKNCKRRVCFFAHSPEQLRILPVSMASAPSSSHGVSEKVDGSPVGSPQGQFPCRNGSVESYPPQEVCMSGAVGAMHAQSFNATAAMVFPPPTTKIHSTFQVANNVGMHLDVSNESALRRAMLQNILACKGYGSNVSVGDYAAMSNRYEGQALEVQMMRHSRFMEGHHKGNVHHKISLPIEKKAFDPAGHSHGFASPTSTLEPHLFSPPPLSPPLSPSTSPNSPKTKHWFTNPANDLHNLCVDNTLNFKNSLKPAYMSNNPSNEIEDLAFCLHELQVSNSIDEGCVQENQHSIVRDRVAADLVRQQGLPSFTHVMSKFASASSKQAFWESSCEFADLECQDSLGYKMDACKIGDDSTSSDNLEPDFGWVTELVK